MNSYTFTAKNSFDIVVLFNPAAKNILEIILETIIFKHSLLKINRN